LADLDAIFFKIANLAINTKNFPVGSNQLDREGAPGT